MSRHGYQKIADFRGKMNLHGSLDAAAIERGDYQRILQSWRISRRGKLRGGNRNPCAAELRRSL